MSEIRADKLHNASGDNDSGIDLSTNDQVDIKIAGSVKARVNSSGTFMIGRTATGYSNTGAQFTASGAQNIFVADGDFALGLNRQSSDGKIFDIRKDGTAHGGIEVASSGSTLDVFLGNETRGLKFRATSVIPRAVSDGSANDVMDLGSSASKFDDVFATNGTIQTSDKNEKQDIEELSDAEKRVAVVARGLMRKYRWKSKVAEKGDKARTHFGIIAQDLEDAFKAEGLDASKYAMFCSDTWWEKEEKYTDNDGKEQTRIMDYEKEEDAPKDATKITRLGVRYSELLAFIISAI